MALRKSSTAVKRADNKPRKASWLGGASSKKNLSKLVGLVGELRKSGHKYFCSWRIPLMILWLAKLMDISSCKLLWISFIRTVYAPVHEMNSANVPLIIDGTPSKDMLAVGVNHPESSQTEQVGFGMFWVRHVFQDPKLLPMTYTLWSAPRSRRACPDLLPRRSCPWTDAQFAGDVTVSYSYTWLASLFAKYSPPKCQKRPSSYCFIGSFPRHAWGHRKFVG